jgi:hypothetical protein
MHEFMPPKPFVVCRNKHAQSTISGLKLMFWVVPRTRPVAETSIGVHLIECFRIVGLQTNYLKDFNALFRSKTHILGIFTPFRCSTMSVGFRTTYFMSKIHISGCFRPFRCRTWPIVKISIGCIKCTSLCLWNHFLFCHNKHAQSTISGLKLMFWVVPCHSVAALDMLQKLVSRCI